MIMDEERYFTLSNLLISILVVGACCLILGFVLGVHARKTTKPDVTTIETTATTEEPLKTMDPIVSWAESCIHSMQERTRKTTTTSTTEETTTSEETTSSTTSTTKATTVTTSKSVKTGEDESNLTLLGTFKGTYYAGKSVPCKGGSGRTLIDCTVGSDGIKGSVASRYAYEKWGYKKDGRTKLYLEIKGYESMNGWYYVDDCNAVSSIIDFYFYKNANCPWKKAGVVEVKAYV